MPALGLDPHSYANYEQITVTNVFPHLVVDFDRKILHGFVDLTCLVKQDGTDVLLLDTRFLSIERCVDAEDESTLLFTLPKHHKELGICLSVPVPEAKRKAGTTVTFRIYYSTSPLSGGIQWFEPHQTSGKKYPMLYTQFEAILARTMIPCQDTPAVKAPYSMRVTVRDPLVAVCSAIAVGEAKSEQLYGQAYKTFEYHQKVPIPSYLIALAVGDFKRAQIGPRSFVYCEESYVKAAVYEFEETEAYLKAGEKICGIDYEWGTYDLLLLPTAFPYGGMENPNATFINSALITGDRSLMSVIAHEITHSWAGNLVTNANWSDFWLNEGFTMYIERLILGEVYSEDVRHFHSRLGYGELLKTVSSFSEMPEFTKLRPNLVDIDPDEAFSRIPYEKGFLFLLFLETIVGGKDKMIPWLQSYFIANKYKSVNSDQMKAHFIAHFGDLKAIDWNEWFFGTGLPAVFNPDTYLNQNMNKAVDQLTAVWKDKQGEGAAKDDLKWDPNQTMVFLDNLINTAVPMSKDVLNKMNQVYGLNATNNVEIAFRWLMLNLESSNLDIMPQVESFLAKNGRGIYVKTLYKQLHAMGKNGTLPLQTVKSIYQSNRSYYHHVIRSVFDQHLK